MFKTVLILVALIASLTAELSNSVIPNMVRGQEQTTQKFSTPAPPIKVTIKTAKNALNAVTDRFNVGDQILVPITMTNTSTITVAVCDSSDLYQDRPTLTRNDSTVSIMNWQSTVQRIVERDHTCDELNLPDPINLNPNEPTIVDWMVLVDSKVPTGSAAWYDSLPPGKYKLSIQRRIKCCDGPTVQSNTVSFEVLP